MNEVRAWKDPAYRRSLSDTEIDALPANPAGLVELTAEDLDGISGGTTSLPCVTATIASIGLTVSFCSPNGTACGSCEWGTNACC